MQVQFTDGDAGSVAIQQLLHERLCGASEFFAALIEQKVHLPFADDFAHGGFSRLHHGLIGIAVIEQEGFGIRQRVLHGERDVDDV